MIQITSELAKQKEKLIRRNMKYLSLYKYFIYVAMLQDKYMLIRIPAGSMSSPPVEIHLWNKNWWTYIQTSDFKTPLFTSNLFCSCDLDCSVLFISHLHDSKHCIQEEFNALWYLSCSFYCQFPFFFKYLEA